MSKLSLILGGIALGACGYGFKKWCDKTKEENAYWTNDSKDILCEMASGATHRAYEATEWLEKRC